MTNKANEDIQYKKPVSLQRAAANLVAVFSYPDTSRPEAFMANILNDNDIVAALFARFTGGYHYMIALYGVGEGNTAIKLHVNNLTGDFAFDTGSYNLLGSLTLCTLIKIGTRGQVSPAEIRAIVEAIPLEVPPADQATEKTFDCRVWFREAVRRLDANGILTCPDIDALEIELERLADPNARSILQGIGRFTYFVATTCT